MFTATDRERFLDVHERRDDPFLTFADAARTMRVAGAEWTDRFAWRPRPVRPPRYASPDGPTTTASWCGVPGPTEHRHTCIPGEGCGHSDAHGGGVRIS
jgi:hypothetical protein